MAVPYQVREQIKPYIVWVFSFKLHLCPVLLLAVAGIWWQVFKEQGTCNSLYNAGQEELRILLVGKTGVGKSATGNTILSKQAFKSDFSFSSVTSQCEKASGIVNGRRVSVIDSPGLFDTQLTADEVVNRIKSCVSFSAPGPHVFLVVIQLGRFTEEEEKTVQIFQDIFGKESSTYTMALFTHGDKLKGKNIQEFMHDNTKLSNFINTFGGRYHVFNNKEPNPEQVVQLLDMIDKMVAVNGGEHYTSEMLQEAERAIEEEKQRILKENEERRLKEIEELKKTFEKEAFEKAKKELEEEYERQARLKAESSFSVFDYLMPILKLIVTVVSHVYGLK